MRRIDIPTELTTDRLLLRAPTEADIDAVYEIFGDPETNRHNPAGPLRDRDAAADLVWRWHIHWAQHGFGLWIVALRDAPEQVIGVGGLSWRDYGGEQRLNLGYRLRPSAWGLGLATELGRFALQVARERLGASEVHALVRPDNLSSRRVLDKLGMRAHGQLRDFPWLPASEVYRHTLEDCLAKSTELELAAARTGNAYQHATRPSRAGMVRRSPVL
ncbi:GNAT family N-acetyltransferase [Chitinimonas naiadis]